VPQSTGMCESGEREARPLAMRVAQGGPWSARSPHAANPHVLKSTLRALASRASSCLRSLRFGRSSCGVKEVEHSAAERRLSFWREP